MKWSSRGTSKSNSFGSSRFCAMRDPGPRFELGPGVVGAIPKGGLPNRHP